MKTGMGIGSIIGLGIATVIVAFVAVIGISFVTTGNKEVDLRVNIEKKQKDNQSEFDNMWKKISQVAQVTDAQKNAIKDVIVGYANARASGGNSGSGATFVNALHEAVPTMDTKTFENLQNIIVGSRDSFTMRQKELLAMSAEHDKLIMKFPSSMICSILGRKRIDITIVTSSKTEHTFETGKDDDVTLFNNGK